MTEAITVRDHGEPCEHGSLWPHWIDVVKARWWKEPECLGGREMVLQRIDEATWREVTPHQAKETDSS